MVPLGRLYRLRLKPGRGLIGFGTPGEQPAFERKGDEIVAPKDVAAALIRSRAVDILEVIDPPADEPQPDR